VQYGEVVQLKPADELAYQKLAMCQKRLGKAAEAVSALRQALELKPDWAAALADLAWLLATSPEAKVRDGAEAVRLAQRAVELTGRTDVKALTALDAAYAEVGQYEQALSVARTARAFALASGQQAPADAAARRMEFYRAHQPFRER